MFVTVLVAVVLGLSNMSPPTPATIPTIPAAATALLHFSALLLETGLLAILSSGNTIRYREGISPVVWFNHYERGKRS